MKRDILLAGIGGQGILTIAYAIGVTALSKGIHVTQAEVHGMAQRGGAVFAHLRLSDRPILSGLIPEGGADVVLSMEPLEVQRYLRFLAPDGVVVTSDQPFKNIPNYPEEREVLDGLFRLPHVVVVNAKRLAEKGGAALGQNMAIMGSAIPWLPLSAEEFAPVVRARFGKRGPAIAESNLDVIRLGAKVGQFYRTLVAQGVASRAAYELIARLEPSTLDESIVPSLRDALLGARAEERIHAVPPDSTCDMGLLRYFAVPAP